MKKIALSLLVALWALASSGCSTTSSGEDEADQGSRKAKIDEMDAVTSDGNRKAVLSLHKRYAYPDACRFGLTLTNNLPYKITNISFRFVAYSRGDIAYQDVLRNFFEIDPAGRQYREIEFSGISCDRIAYVEVRDPGRCAMDDLTRFSSQPGDCIARVQIVETPYVRLVRSAPATG